MEDNHLQPQKSKLKSHPLNVMWVVVVVVIIILSTVLFIIFLAPGLFGCANSKVIQSNSMSHSENGNEVGIIDMGDTVCYTSAPSKDDIVTYIEGRASGYSRFGDFGDVIIFEKYGTYEVPIIHRVMAYVIWNETHDSFDIPGLEGLELNKEWGGVNNDGSPVTEPYNLTDRIWIKDVGYAKTNLTIRFAAYYNSIANHNASAFYLTAGDHNLGIGSNQPDAFIVKQDWILGKITNLTDN